MRDAAQLLESLGLLLLEDGPLLEERGEILRHQPGSVGMEERTLAEAMLCFRRASFFL